MKMRKLRRQQAVRSVKFGNSCAWARRLPPEFISLVEGFRALVDAIGGYADMHYSKTNGMGS